MDSLLLNAHNFLGWLLSSTCQASLLICLILGLQWALRHRLGVRARHLLWVLVLIRLALPWAPQSRLSAYNLLPDLPRKGYQTFRDSEAGVSPTYPAERDEIYAAGPLSSSGSGAYDSTEPSPAQGRHWPIYGSTERVIVCLALFWLAGVGALGACILAGNMRIWRRIRHLRPVTDPEILDLLADCRRQIGAHSPVRIIATDLVNGPALFGLIRPRLLLPYRALEMERSELRYVFLHELAHLKRHDILVGVVASVLHVLHWFNPLITYAFQRMRAERELACDGLALSCLHPHETAAYGQTVICLIEQLQGLGVDTTPPFDPLPSHMLLLTHFYPAEESGIWNLTGIEAATNLVELGIGSNQISDLSPILGLTNLVVVHFPANHIDNLDSLTGAFFPNLEALSLQENQITSISAMSTMMLPKLRGLDISDNQLTNLSGLEGILSIEQLGADRNQIDDISALSALPNLQRLGLNGNQIVSIPDLPDLDLSGLISLTELDLGNNPMNDISGLSGLPGIEVLNLSHCELADLGPLAGLSSLKDLNAGHNVIQDVSPLEDLVGLTSLRLRRNNITDITDLSGLWNLRTLYLSINDVTDLTPLENKLPLLEDFQLGYNEVIDISPLASMPELRVISLLRNRVVDISLLTGLTNLEFVDLRTNPLSRDSYCIYIDDILEIHPTANIRHDDYDCAATIPHIKLRQAVIDALAALIPPVITDNPTQGEIAQLQHFDAYGRGIVDLEGLQHATSLLSLHLEQNYISYITPLAPLANLEELGLFSNYITDLSPLTGLGNLRIADLGDNPISDIGALAGKAELWRLHIAPARISDISVLAGLLNLRDVQLWNNQISDISPLLTLTTLEELRLGQNPLSRDSYCGYIPLIRGNNPNLELFQYDQGQYNCGGEPEPGVIGNWEYSMDGWWAELGVNAFFNDTVGVTRDSSSLEVRVSQSDWQPVVSLDLFRDGLVQDFANNNTVSLDVTRLVEDWSTNPSPNWSNVNIIIEAGGDGWGFGGPGLGSQANWVPEHGDQTQTATWSYGGYLSMIDFNNLWWLSLVVMSNCDPAYEGEIRLYLDNVQLSFAEPELVTFADQNLKQAVMDALEITIDPTTADMARLESLSAKNLGITDLTGLEHAMNLGYLNLPGNNIGDPSLVSGLTNLWYLNLSGSPISDLTFLSELTNLVNLRLWWAQITDLTPIAGLTGLQELWIQGNLDLADISPLSGLTSLEFLQMRRTAVSDLSPLAGMTQLRELRADSTQVSNLTPLTNLTGLVELRVNNNQIDDISPLAGLTSLVHLRIDNNQIADVSVVEGLTNLESISLWHNQISDLTPLIDLAYQNNWIEIDVQSNLISDLTPFSTLAAMGMDVTHLDLSDNQISDISPLSALTELVELKLNENQISDVSPLQYMTNLALLYLVGNPLSWDAYCEYAAILYTNNPGIDIAADDSPYNCSVAPEETPVGASVPVTPEDNTHPGTSPVTLTFEQIAESGGTSLVTSNSGPTPPSGFQLILLKNPLIQWT